MKKHSIFMKKFVSGKALILAVLFLSVLPVNAAEWRLADDGVSKSVVVISEVADAAERHAAEELAYFLSKVTGADITQTGYPSCGKYPIWLGTPETNPAIGHAGLEERVRTLPSDGFLLYADEDGLIIAGSEPLGVLFGTYAFLEEHVGIRWFYPGEDGEYCPEKPGLSVGRIDDLQEPSFQVRDVQFSRGGWHQRITDTWDWIARNRMTAAFYPGVEYSEEYKKRGGRATTRLHMMHRIVRDELFEEHPEYFGLYDGERQKGRQLCTTNPEVVNLVADYLIDWFNNNPEGIFYLDPRDHTRFCECEECTALDPPGEVYRQAGQYSTRFTIFRNEVAERVFETHPEAEIHILSYQRYRLPPLKAEPDTRLWNILCDHGRCFRHSLDNVNCEANELFREMFEGWAEFANPRGYFPYYNMIGWTPEEGIVSVPMENIVAADMRYMHSLGHKGWSLRIRPPDAGYSSSADIPAIRKEFRANFPWFYIQAKLAWNINTDVEALLEDMHKKLYGPAAPAMIEYRNSIRKLWEETPGHHIYGTLFSDLGKSIASPGAESELVSLLGKAEQSVKGKQPYLKRVKEDRMIFENSWKLAHQRYAGRPVEDIEADRRLSEITIDGVLDEPDWEEQQRVTGFVKRGTDGYLADAQTYVRLLFDDGFLYVGLEMHEPHPEDIAVKAMERDSSLIWEDDTVEVFIDPEGEGEKYVHIAVNPAGVFRDSVRKIGMPTSGDSTYDSGAEIAAVLDIGRGRWTVEMKIPADIIGGDIIEGGSWKMDVGRVRRLEEGFEASSWFDGMFHRPENFRRVSFSRPLIKNSRFDEVAEMRTDADFRRHATTRWQLWEYGNEPALMALDWRLSSSRGGKITFLTDDVFSGRHSVKIDDGNMHQQLDGEIKGGDLLRISFAAKGKGRILMRTYHAYRDPETGRREGYKPEVPVPHTERLSPERIELNPQWERYEVIYTHPADYPPYVSLAFHVYGTAVLDSVSVTPLRQ